MNHQEHQKHIRKSLTTLMTMVDNQMDNVMEGEYIDICRMLKFIYSNPQIIPAEINNQPQEPRPIYNTLEISNIRCRLESAICILQQFDNSRVAVKLDDKMAVIRENYEDVMLLVMGNPLYFNHNLRTKISVMEAHLIGNGIVEKRNLISAYHDKRDLRIETQRAPLARNVSALRAALEEAI